MSTLLQDLRYTLRCLVHAPLFSTVAIVTVALGIGANTAIFSVFNAVLLRDLPFPEPHRMVRLQLGTPLTARQIDGLRERSNSYEAFAGGARTSLTLTGSGTPEELSGSVVGYQHHLVFGVAPALGRAFLEQDAQPGAPAVAVISHELWQRRFGGDPTIAGNTLLLGGEGGTARTVVGVWPPGYRPFGWETDVYVPMVRDPASHLYTDMARFQLAGRMRESTSLALATSEFRGTVERMTRGEEGAFFSKGSEAGAALVHYKDAETGGVGGRLWLLLAAVGLVLLIACANVTNLVLARSAARSHEIAVRTAIGAGRGRMIRQLLTESLVLASLGGLVGGLVAVLGLPLLQRALPPALPRSHEISIDLGVLAFAAGITVLAGLAFGVLPALRSTRSVGSALRSGSYGLSSGRGRFRLQHTLVAVQVGLCLVLVAASGLLLKSLWLVGMVDPGFDPDGLVTLRVRPAAEAYLDPARRANYFEDTLERIRSLPGVEAAGGIQVLPMTPGNMGVGISPDGAPVPDGERPTFVGYRLVTPGYGEAMKIPLLEGRWLGAQDHAEAIPSGMINQRMAQALFPDQPATGQTVYWNTGDPWFQVVGVMGNVHQNRLDEAPRMEAYVPVAQNGDANALHLMVRSSAGLSVLPSLRQAAWSVDADVPITEAAAMTDVVSASLADRRFQAILFTLFGGLALVLGAVGVYGVTSYVVGQRSHDIGVRLALGAQRMDVVRSTLASALTPIGIGLALGLPVSLAAGRLFSGVLYQVTPWDPAVLAGVTAVLAVTGALAALAPARRASRADPAMVLTRR